VADYLAMVDWVHCNSCYGKADEVKKPFFLTNCGHIFCSSCAPTGKWYICRMGVLTDLN